MESLEFAKSFDKKEKRSEKENSALIERLKSIIRVVSGNSKLHVTTDMDPYTRYSLAREGKDPDRTWFRFKHKGMEYVHVPPEITENEDEAMGIACHEAGHVLVTRLGEIVPDEVLKTPGFTPVMMATEERPTDYVIRSRFLGAKKWLEKARKNEVSKSDIKSERGLSNNALFSQLCNLIVYEPYTTEQQKKEQYPQEVLDLYEKIKDDIQNVEADIPNKGDDEEKVKEHSISRYKTIYSKIFPKLQELIKKDTQNKVTKNTIEDLLSGLDDMFGEAPQELLNEVKEKLKEELEKITEQKQKERDEKIDDLIKDLEDQDNQNIKETLENAKEVLDDEEIKEKIEENKDLLEGDKKEQKQEHDKEQDIEDISDQIDSMEDMNQEDSDKLSKKINDEIDDLGKNVKDEELKEKIESIKDDINSISDEEDQESKKEKIEQAKQKLQDIKEELEEQESSDENSDDDSSQGEGEEGEKQDGQAQESNQQSEDLGEPGQGDPEQMQSGEQTQQMTEQARQKLIDDIKEKLNQQKDENIDPMDNIDEMSQKMDKELKDQIEEVFDSLPQDVKDQIKEQAEKDIKEISDQITEELRPNLDEEEVKTNAELDYEKIDDKDSVQGNAENERILAPDDKERLSVYDDTYSEVRKFDDVLYEELERIFNPNKNEGKIYKDSGSKINLRKVIKREAEISSGATPDNKFFEQKRTPEKKDYFISLMVDLSGSMRGEKIRKTLSGVVLISEVLNRLGVDFEVKGFQDQVIDFKAVDENMDDLIRSRIGGAIGEVNGMNPDGHNRPSYNDDGPCLEEIYQEVKDQKHKSKFIFVMSDGEPAGRRVSGNESQYLHDVISNIEKEKEVDLIGLGLGSGTGHVKKFYKDKALPNIDLDELPEKISELLKQIIENPESMR